MLLGRVYCIIDMGLGKMGWRGWRCICKCIAIKRLPDLYFAHLPFPSSYLLVQAPHLLCYTVVNILLLFTQSICTYFPPDISPVRTGKQAHTKWRLTLDLYNIHTKQGYKHSSVV